MHFVIYFFAGVVQDFLLTLNWRFVSKEAPFKASFFSFLTTVVSLTVFYDIVSNLDPEQSLMAITIYALGIAVGTFLGTKIKIGKEPVKPTTI